MKTESKVEVGRKFVAGLDTWARTSLRVLARDTTRHVREGVDVRVCLLFQPRRTLIRYIITKYGNI